MQATKAKIYSITEINALVKGVLDAGLPGRLTVKGEISGWKQHGSGHCYFTLKDEGSVLPCAMWRPNVARMKFHADNGLAVLATGFVDVYIPQGRYSLIVEEMAPAGVGALQLAFEQMVKKLRAEGLFNDEHKKPLPKYPQRIGILTSESGAAVHDIADSIHNRWPCTRLFLYPVPVQGEGAAEQIAAAIGDVNRRNARLKLDLLIVGRGGGSLEDLWAFNEEVLARAIYASKIPIISAVGHEVDVTVADLVADARASTPTKAGIVAVPDVVDVLAELANQERRLTATVRSRLDLCAEHVQTVLASAVFRNPTLAIRNRQQHVDELADSLAEALRLSFAEARSLLQDYYEQVVQIEPHRLLGRMSVELNEWKARQQAAVINVLSRSRLQLTAQGNRLIALDPRSVLKRGYSITMNKQSGRVVRTPDDVQIGESLLTELAGGNRIDSQVTGKDHSAQ